MTTPPNTTGGVPAIRPRRFRSLASRMIAVGLLQLVLLAATAITIFVLEGPRGPVQPEEHVDPRKLELVATDPAALQQALAELRDERVQVSIYNSERQLIASNVDPPLAVPPRWRPRGPGPDDRGGPPPRGDRPPPPGDDEPGPPPGDRPRLRGDRPMLAPFHVDGDRGVLIARGAPARPPGWAGPVITLVCGLLILVLGAVVTARWIVRPIDRLARAARALGRGDLAARSRLERTDEIGELGDRFDEMADRIENLVKSEKELFANVAHELRTPLARIGVALDLAGEGDAEAARASLAEIAVDVTELETIVDDILTAMRFEIGSGTGAVARLPLRKAHVTPASIVATAVERQRARHPGRTLDVSVAADLPMLEVDPMLVRRVLDNLLENAHKYTPDPGRPTAISARLDGSRVVFEVADRGLGIGAEDLPHVFTAFFRGERSRSRETGGVGLGLTLAKRIVEAHDGTIEATSTAGAGTTIRVALPSAT